MVDSGSLFSQLGGVLNTPTAALAGGVQTLERQVGGRGAALLPTPDAYAADRGGSQPPEKRRAGGHSVSLSDVTEHLLPTPKAGDADFGMPRTSGRPPEKSTHLMTRLAYTSPNAMLPTPQAHDHVQGKTPEQVQAMRKRTGAGVRNLNEVSVNELPSEHAAWGQYAAAVERWEHLGGRRAPDPTEAGPKGGRRLAALFVEWLMGLPAGWVTGVPGVVRSPALKMLGNGVVPQQAIRALGDMRERSEA